MGFVPQCMATSAWAALHAARPERPGFEVILLVPDSASLYAYFQQV